MKRVLFTLLTCIISTYSFSQAFEGKLVYSVTYSNLPPEMKGMESMLPQTQVMYIKGQKSRVETKTGASNTIIISDNDSGTSTVLTEAMGQKFKMTYDAKAVKEAVEAQGNPVIKYMDETKEIAGYLCKKAEVTLEGILVPATFYYTEDIQPIVLKGMENMEMKGMPLEYTISAQGLTMTMTAIEVNKETVSDSSFVIPDGYSEMPAQMKQMMGNH